MNTKGQAKDLKSVVRDQVFFLGRSPGGCKLIIHDLLDNGRDIFQAMQLFKQEDIVRFYYNHQEEIGTLCAEEDELVTDTSVRGYVKLALEKTLILIEGEIKNGTSL